MKTLVLVAGLLLLGSEAAAQTVIPTSKLVWDLPRWHAGHMLGAVPSLYARDAYHRPHRQKHRVTIYLTNRNGPA